MSERTTPTIASGAVLESSIVTVVSGSARCAVTPWPESVRLTLSAPGGRAVGVLVGVNIDAGVGLLPGPRVAVALAVATGPGVPPPTGVRTATTAVGVALGEAVRVAVGLAVG